MQTTRNNKRHTHIGNQLSELYGSDRVGWLDQTVALIKQRRFRELDYGHLREYLLYWARRDRQEVRYRLLALLTNLLKIRFAKRCKKKWELALLHQQFQMKDVIESPSLKRLAEKRLRRVYPLAVRKVAAELGLPLSRLPQKCSYTIHDLLAYERHGSNG